VVLPIRRAEVQEMLDIGVTLLAENRQSSILHTLGSAMVRYAAPRGGSLRGEGRVVEIFVPKTSIPSGRYWRAARRHL